AAQRIARFALAGDRQVAADHHLGRDPGVVGAHLPQRAVAAHAVVAHQRVLQGVLERMAHVQGAGDVGRRQQDGVGGTVAAWGDYARGFPFRVVACLEVAGVVIGVELVGYGGRVVGAASPRAGRPETGGYRVAAEAAY